MLLRRMQNKKLSWPVNIPTELLEELIPQLLDTEMSVKIKEAQLYPAPWENC